MTEIETISAAILADHAEVERLLDTDGEGLATADLRERVRGNVSKLTATPSADAASWQAKARVLALFDCEIDKLVLSLVRDMTAAA